jgi:hypothetical protein
MDQQDRVDQPGQLGLPGPASKDKKVIRVKRENQVQQDLQDLVDQQDQRALLEVLLRDKRAIKARKEK